jgi:hypothetical protein
MRHDQELPMFLWVEACNMAVYVQCYPQFIGITKEMMSRGPHVVDMEYREIDD